MTDKPIEIQRPFREFEANIAIRKGENGSEPHYEKAIKAAANRLRFRLGIEEPLAVDVSHSTIDGQDCITATVRVFYG